MQDFIFVIVTLSLHIYPVVAMIVNISFLSDYGSPAKKTQVAGGFTIVSW